MTDQKIQAAHYYQGRSRPVRLIVVHDMEAPESSTTAESVARYFARDDSRQASAHLCVDNDSAVVCVDDEDTAWAAKGANSDGWHIEHAGYARQTRAEWLDAFGQAMLRISANRAALRAVKWHIPVVKLTGADIKAGKAGFCGHRDVSDAYPSTGHTDPGADFPWDHFLALVQQEVARLTSPPAPCARKTTNPEQGTPSWYGRPLKRGFTGPDVRVAKHNLGLALTGDREKDYLFDSDMERAVRKLQHDNKWTLNNRISAREAKVIG